MSQARTWPRFAWLSAPLIAVLGATAGVAQVQAARLDALVSQYHDAGLFDGAVLVADQTGVVFQKGYGLADREWGVPNTPEAKYRLASLTKQFTAMAILQLVDRGKLKLDEKLSDALPYYRKDTGAKVTIHQLLNHTSGIPNYLDAPGFFEKEAHTPHEVRQFVQEFCSGDLEFEPGAKMRYSNSGYYILGAIIEQAMGKGYEQALQEQIWQPLGMRATGLDRPEVIVEKRVAGYDRTLGRYANAPTLNASVTYAAGGLYSTVGDLYLWDRALYTDRLVSPELKKKMFTPGLENYGYGWGVRPIPIGPGDTNRTVASHAGGRPGCSTLIRRVLEDQLLVVLLDNAGARHESLTELSDGLFDVLYGRLPAPPRRSAALAILPTVEQRGGAAAVQQCRELKLKSPRVYFWDENEFNLLGYDLLGRGRIQDALAVLQFNVEQFPKSFNVYDSLAEAQAAAGLKDEAIRNYHRSLEINPRNQNAATRLKPLEAR